MLLIRITFAVCHKNIVCNGQAKTIYVICLYKLVSTKGWSISPVMIYDKDAMLNPNIITLEENCKIVQLLCVVSRSHNNCSMVESFKDPVMSNYSYIL